MLSRFFPDHYEKSVFTVDYEKLRKLGFKGIIFDIDNTLVHHGDNSTPEVDELFRKLHALGLKTVLLTNNDEERVARFITNIDTEYVCNAEKPKPDGYKKALRLLGLKNTEAVFIGDQIFTDVYGAKRCGIATILVDFIKLEGETYFGKRRMAEAFVLKFRTKKQKQKHLY